MKRHPSIKVQYLQRNFTEKYFAFHLNI